ncbi:MAG: hypothetical protein AAB864_00750 [Patescibacteria group bacterium]
MRTFIDVDTLKRTWLKIVLGIIVLGTVIWAYRAYSGKTATVADKEPAAQTSPAPSPSPTAPPEPLSPLTAEQTTADIATNRRYSEYAYDNEIQQMLIAKARLQRMRVEKEAADLLASKCCGTDPADTMRERINQLERKLTEQKIVYIQPPPPPLQPTPRPEPAHPCVSYQGRGKSECLTTLHNKQKWEGGS